EDEPPPRRRASAESAMKAPPPTATETASTRFIHIFFKTQSPDKKGAHRRGASASSPICTSSRGFSLPTRVNSHVFTDIQGAVPGRPGGIPTLLSFFLRARLDEAVAAQPVRRPGDGQRQGHVLGAQARQEGLDACAVLRQPGPLAPALRLPPEQVQRRTAQHLQWSEQGEHRPHPAPQAPLGWPTLGVRDAP